MRRAFSSSLPNFDSEISALLQYPTDLQVLKDQNKIEGEAHSIPQILGMSNDQFQKYVNFTKTKFEEQDLSFDSEIYDAMEVVMINKYFNEAEGKYQRIEMEITEPILSKLTKGDSEKVGATPEEIADKFIDRNPSIMDEYLNTSKEGMR
jgi:hypothetical protein